MAFERLQALGPFLDQLKETDGFEKLKEDQCALLTRELRGIEKLEISEATPLLVLIEQGKHWSKEQKETLQGAIRQKVEETIALRSGRARFPMQNYTMFPIYLTARDWCVVLDASHNVAQKCDCIMSRLWSLGLRCPSEPTAAMLTATLLLHEPQRFSDGLQLRSSYISVKSLMKGFIKGKTQAQFNPPVVLKELPPSTTAIPKELYDATYDQEEKPGPLPPGVTLEKLKQLEEMIPNRSNNKQLQIQVPKAAGVPFMDSTMGMAATNFVANMFMGMFQQHQQHGLSHPALADAGRFSKPDLPLVYSKLLGYQYIYIDSMIDISLHFFYSGSLSRFVSLL